jgi:hypothetical protein
MFVNNIIPIEDVIPEEGKNNFACDLKCKGVTVESEYGALY